MCNYDNSIDEADDWIIFSIDRLDNAKIVSGSDWKSVQVWDASASTGAALHQSNGHTDWVKSVAFSYDGVHIVSG